MKERVADNEPIQPTSNLSLRNASNQYHAMESNLLLPDEVCLFRRCSRFQADHEFLSQLILGIFRALPVNHRLRARRTCRVFNRLLSDPSLWRYLCVGIGLKGDYPPIEDEDRNPDWTEDETFPSLAGIPGDVLESIVGRFAPLADHGHATRGFRLVAFSGAEIERLDQEREEPWILNLIIEKHGPCLQGLVLESETSTLDPKHVASAFPTLAPSLPNLISV